MYEEDFKSATYFGKFGFYVSCCVNCFFCFAYFIMVNCCFLVNNFAINFLTIAMILVLQKASNLELFSFANNSNFAVINISLKSLSNLG